VRYLLLVLLCQILTAAAFAKNHNPSSGRRLQYGHWLTCEGGSSSAVRTSATLSPLKITKYSSQEDINRDVPQFSGMYGFTVQDTWEEMVTKSGSSCFHCGETCNSRNDKNECTSTSCNFCSWQELETFYRPWSTQSTNWKVGWRPNENYRQKHTEWIRNNKPEQTKDMAKLVEFDTDRPNEYFLFPGETEVIQISNSGVFNILAGGDTISPTVGIKGPRSKHTINWTVNGSSPGTRECDDVNLTVDASVSTGNREVTEPPNSIEFAANFVEAQKDSSGALKQQPFNFRLIDTSAMYYNEQNVMDHFKDTKIVVRLWQLDRFLWFDRSVSGRHHVSDTKSVIGSDTSTGLPPFATYVVKAEELLTTKWFGKRFSLRPGSSYQICAKMHRKNNVYYKETVMGIEDWSPWNCQQFAYSETAPDERSGGRKFNDGVGRWLVIPQPVFYLFDWVFDPFFW
jgi:hypothetical protein